MEDGLQQLSGDWFLFAGPLLAGVAVFLLIWLVLRGWLQRPIDRVSSKGVPSWQISKTFQVPLGPLGAGDDPAGAAQEVKAEWGTPPLEGVREQSPARRLDAARREHYLALWRQAQARFAEAPAEAVREAERLLAELMREGGSPSIVLTRTARFDSDAEFGAVLADVGSMFRTARHGRAAARGISSAKARRDASVDDLAHAMKLYQRAFEQRLGAEDRELDSLASGSETPVSSGNGPYGRRSNGDPTAEETARERADAERIVREAMGPSYERAEAGRTLGTLNRSAQVLDRFLHGLLCVAAITILVGGVLIMLTMDAASRSQGGRFYVAIIVLVLLGAVDRQFTWLLRRRALARPPAMRFDRRRGPDGQAFSFTAATGPQSARSAETPDQDRGRAHAGTVHSLLLLLSAATMSPTDDERRYARGSLLLLVFLAVVLVGFALLFP